MAVYTKESKLSEPIFRDPSLIPVINRFGIHLGVGDMSIREICSRVGVDTDFFLAVVNTYLNHDYFPEKIIGRVHMSMIVDYLEKTDGHYINVQLPNIERHFNLLLRKDSETNNVQTSNLMLLNKFFYEVKDELMCSVRDDMSGLFPWLRKQSTGEAMPLKRMRLDGMTEEKTCCVISGNKDLEDKIRDLISFFIVHLKGNYDENLCVAVVSALFTLEKDIKQNNRIRERILKPLCLE